jgi:putative FmdB family regulatory protein
MPTYEFACPAGHRFDKFYSKISDSVSELPCAECDATAVRQLSGGGGLIFKGSGFYITDYGKDGKKPAASGKTDATKGAGEGSSSGGEKGGGESARRESGSGEGAGAASTKKSESGGSGSGPAPKGGASGGSSSE